MSKHTNMDGMSIIPQANGENKPENAFSKLLRAYEIAYSTGVDTASPLYALATAAAMSVLKKCIDPQRKTATERETVSDDGISTALQKIRRGIMADNQLLDSLTTAHNNATAFQYNDNGDYIRVTVDKNAEKAAAALQGETLSDGLDLVNTAIVAILEQTEKCDTAVPGWLEKPYTMRKLSKKVVIQASESAKWETVETTPIQEVYRAIRREIQNSRAVQTDPKNDYLYIEDMTADPDSDKTETIYNRLHKWADIGGYTHTGEYTVDRQAMVDYNDIIAKLNLTSRQATIVRLRMSGYGCDAISSYLGISAGNVYNMIKRIREKCEKIGFTYGMWKEMNDNE